MKSSSPLSFAVPRARPRAYHRAVKVLRLTTSNDVVLSGPGSRIDWLKRLGEERFGEPLEIVVKPVWPDSRLPAAAERWIAHEQPDIVWMLVQSFWFEYLSVPKKLERKFGRVGKAASNAGFRAADTPWLSRNPLFRQGRRFLQRTFDGDPHFTVPELYEAVEGVARASLRNEGIQFIAWGPFSYTNYGVTARQTARAVAWRSDLIARIRRLSNELHFHFGAPDRPYWQTEPAMTMHTDQFHFAMDEQRRFAERELEVLATVWETQGATPRETAPA